jgi:hypothetical protein
MSAKLINSIVPGFAEFFESNKEIINSEYLLAPQEVTNEFNLETFALEVFLELE